MEQAASRSQRCSVQPSSSLRSDEELNFDRSLCIPTKYLQIKINGAHLHKYKSIKTQIASFAVKCKDIFQDLKVQIHERPALLVCVEFLVGSCMRVLRSSLHGTMLDGGIHKAHINHKILGITQMQLILVTCFHESDFACKFPGSFLGPNAPEDILKHANH